MLCFLKVVCSQHNINKVWLEEVIIRVAKTWCYRGSVKTVEPICAISAVLQFHSVGAVITSVAIYTKLFFCP